MIIRTQTNDATRSRSLEFVDILLQLKTLIKETFSKADVTYSTTSIRSDNEKSTLTVKNLCYHIVGLNIDILDNRNITSQHLGRKVLHANKASISCLAINIINKFGHVNFEHVIAGWGWSLGMNFQ